MKLAELKELIDKQAQLQTKIVIQKLLLSSIEKPDYSCMSIGNIQLPETTKSDNDILLGDLATTLITIDSILKDKGIPKELRDRTSLNFVEDYDNRVFIEYNYYITEPKYKQDKINEAKAEVEALQEQLNEVESKMKELGLEF